jgi:hypothetical protein
VTGGVFNLDATKRYRLAFFCARRAKTSMPLEFAVFVNPLGAAVCAWMFDQELYRLRVVWKDLAAGQSARAQEYCKLRKCIIEAIA